MSPLHEQILQMPVADRLQLTAFIASSLSPEAVQSAAFGVPDVWVEEALARNEAYSKGSSQGLDWEEVNLRIRDARSDRKK